MEVKAIWDTGATASVITQRVADKLGLKPTGIVEVHTAAGKTLADVHYVNIWLPNHVGFKFVRVSTGELGDNHDLLIGMDIINMTDFAITNRDGRTTWTVRMPSSGNIDFVHEVNYQRQGLIAPQPAKSPNTLRPNDRCHCGSGKKFKKCCGRAA